MSGKKLRMAQIFKNEHFFIVPMDHSVTYGPIKGLVDYKGTILKVMSSGADTVVVHKGLLKNVANDSKLAGFPYIMHLSASVGWDAHPEHKILVGDVEEAVRYGASGVSIHINLNTEYTSQMIRDLGQASELCQRWGMPLLAMMYISDKTMNENSSNIIHAARIAEELGADLVKILYPGKDVLEKLLSSVTIPVVISGGEKMNKFNELLIFVNECLSVGVKGIAIGRNIFQQKDIALSTNILSQLVNEKLCLEECLKMLEREEN